MRVYLTLRIADGGQRVRTIPCSHQSDDPQAVSGCPCSATAAARARTRTMHDPEVGPEPGPDPEDGDGLDVTEYRGWLP